jgi:photosystem II stability/assembly factor-like uncharacterized protein
MPDRDDLEDWLDGRVDPLPPPPGTFELIKRRARRRKYRRLAITAGAAAAVVAAAVTVPQVVSLHVLSPSPASSGVAAGQPAAPSPTGGGTAASSSASPLPSSPPPAPVPPGFQPASVTFVSTGTGWVIGQAGTPGHCATRYCTSIARTDDAGRTWSGVPAPLTGPPGGATGVGQIRFLNGSDGWAFGPELFATHDGGRTWTAVGTGGLRVTGLETVGDRAFALFASCSGTGQAFAARCTGYTLYSSPASADAWAPVGPSTSGLTDAGQDGAAAIVLTGTRGYLLAPDGMVYAGPADGSAPWQATSRVPCAVGSAQPDGQPAGALLAAASATNLVLACTPPPAPGGEQKKLIFASADGGSSWHPVGPVSAGPPSGAAVAPAAGVAASLAASPTGTVVLGTDQGIDVLPAGSSSWQRATVTAAPAGGFAFVGMTTGTQGVAVPADPASGTVWFTFDGGQTWQPSPVASP